jgi:hypothetical protein
MTDETESWIAFGCRHPLGDETATAAKRLLVPIGNESIDFFEFN